jgi:phospholipase/carboxylesterase
MTDAIVIQAPPGRASQLMLMFHGVGARPRDLVPLGQRLAAEFPDALVVSIPGAHRSDLGAGFQWFSVRGITEENRPARVAEAMPAFQEAVRHWQENTGIEVDATTLIGFSQGAIMALEATRHRPVLAGRVVAIAGRFATIPDAGQAATTLHLVHGQADPVIDYRLSVMTAERLGALGGNITVDVLPSVGHEINAPVVDAVLKRLVRQ